jgi:uncharacterized membrane protein
MSFVQRSQEVHAMPIRSLTAAALAAAFSLSLVANAAAYDCEEQVNEALQEQGISQNEVDSVKLTRRTTGAKTSKNYTYDAWVRLKSCDNGALVVHMARMCMVQDIYTTGDCQVGKVPKY